MNATFVRSIDHTQSCHKTWLFPAMSWYNLHGESVYEIFHHPAKRTGRLFQWWPSEALTGTCLAYTLTYTNSCDVNWHGNLTGQTGNVFGNWAQSFVQLGRVSCSHWAHEGSFAKSNYVNTFVLITNKCLYGPYFAILRTNESQNIICGCLELFAANFISRFFSYIRGCDRSIRPIDSQ